MGELKLDNAVIWSDRWRLGALTKNELKTIGFVSVLIGLLYVLFHLLGNTVENVESRSAFVWMVARWGDKESFGADYSHGYLIPFVSLWVIWCRRADYFSAAKAVCKWGLAVIVLALVLHWVGAKMQQTRISLISLILLLWGVPLYFFGWPVAKLLIFPCAYLIFCVPLNFLDALSGPLQGIAVKMGHANITALGIECHKNGNMLISPYFSLNVAEACSGLRSLLAMTALTAVYAYFTMPNFWLKWVLFLSSIPIAVIGNVGRIDSIAIYAVTTGQEFAAGVHHDWAGYVFFAVGISLMVGLARLLQVDYKEFYRSWKETYLSRS